MSLCRTTGGGQPYLLHASVGGIPVVVTKPGNGGIRVKGSAVSLETPNRWLSFEKSCWITSLPMQSER